MSGPRACACGSTKTRLKRGMCDTCYARWLRAQPKRPRPTIDQRFWAKVDKQDGCWLWTASATPAGYGRFIVQGERGSEARSAHRWSYEQARGPIPDGMVIDHLCRTPSCVKPSHLEAVTIGENTSRGLRGWGMLGGLCRNGLHDITDEANVYRRRSDGARSCLGCRNNRRQKQAIA